MAITSIEEMHENREAPLSSSSQGVDAPYTRTYQIISDALITDLRDVRALAGVGAPGPDTIPVIGETYPSDTGSQCFELVPLITESRLVYLLTANYKNPPPGGFGEDPTTPDWNFTTGTETEQIVAKYDLGGHGSAGGDGTVPITDEDGTTANLPPLTGSAGVRDLTNSATERYNPSLQEPRYIRVYNLTKFLSTWDEDEAQERIGKINSASFTFLGMTIPKHCMLCTRYDTGGKQQQSTGSYYSINVQLKLKMPYTFNSDNVKTYANGWIRAVVDQGFNQLIGGVLTPIPLESNSLSQQPQLLNGAGVKQLNAPNFHPVFRQFRTKGSDDMSTWGLPTAIT